MAAIEVALFVADKLFDVGKSLNERSKGPEIQVTNMFYKPKIRMPAHWEFDEDTFHNGMPIKVVNYSKSKPYTISFFCFHTSYKVGKKTTEEDHHRIVLDAAHKNHTLLPGHVADFSLPWLVVTTSAVRSFDLQVMTKHVGDHTFTLNFHNDFENKDYPSKPLDPFFVKSEGNRKLQGR